MQRKLLIAAGATAIALATAGTVIAVRAGSGGDPTVVAAGEVAASNNVTACSAIGGGGGLCTIKLSGDYFDYGLLGDGKYAATLTIDWSTYAANPNNGNEMCASISGPMTFTTGSSVLKTSVLGAADFSQSEICENPNGSVNFDRDYNLNAQVVGGTGKFKKINTGSSNVGVNGMEYAQLNSTQTEPTGKYLDSPNINANLNFS